MIPKGMIINAFNFINVNCLFFPKVSADVLTVNCFLDFFMKESIKCWIIQCNSHY